MLTPIRTRGRRKRPWAAGDGVPKPIASGPKGGRPMLLPEARQASSQSTSTKRARLVKPSPPKPRKSLSRLESLPVELIEKIFLYSLNVNLPRCSRPISAAISSERVYRVLTLLAFWDDSSTQFPTPMLQDTARPETATSIESEATATVTGAAEISRILRPLDYVPLTKNERKALQTSVLRCRWCTIERLLSHTSDLMRLTIYRYWLNANINMTRDSEDSLRLLLAQQGDVCSFKGMGKDGNHYTLSVVPLVSITVNCLETEQQTTHPILDVLEIPDKLLSGTDAGFSESHSRFLEILRMASGFNCPDVAPTDISFSREAIQHGIHTALIEHNTDALTTLLKIDEYTFRGENTTATQALPYMLPSEHFHTAVRVARDDPSLFQLLLRASAESLPSDDSEITQWAMDLDGSFGPWLLDFMLQLPERVKAATNDTINGAMFYLGGINTQLAIAQIYLRDVLGLEGLEQWMGESPYDLSSE